MQESTRQGLTVATTLLVRALAHALASAVLIGGLLALTFVGYFGLLAWAVLAGDGIGGPLAFPVMMILAFVVGFAMTAFVIFPVTVATAVLCELVLKWHRVAQIPIAVALCLAEVLAIALVIALSSGGDVADALAAGGVVGFLLLVPLGVYWWVLQLVDGLRWAAHALWRRIRRAPTGEAPPRLAV